LFYATGCAHTTNRLHTKLFNSSFFFSASTLDGKLNHFAFANDTSVNINNSLRRREEQETGWEVVNEWVGASRSSPLCFLIVAEGNFIVGAHSPHQICIQTSSSRFYESQTQNQISRRRVWIDNEVGIACVRRGKSRNITQSGKLKELY